jgi:hypothetical protein
MGYKNVQEFVMKKLVLLCCATILFFLPAYVFAASCDSDEGYYVNFILEGEEYSCSFGNPDGDVEVPYAAVTLFDIAQEPGGEHIQLYGSNIETGTNPEDLDFIINVQGYLYTDTPGNYTGEYDLEDVLSSVWIWIYSDSIWYPYTASSGTVTIDVFNEIGGSVEGSFNASFIISGDTIIRMDLGDSPQTITGSFRVKRIGEEDLPVREFN